MAEVVACSAAAVVVAAADEDNFLAFQHHLEDPTVEVGGAGAVGRNWLRNHQHNLQNIINLFDIFMKDFCNSTSSGMKNDII